MSKIEMANRCKKTSVSFGEEVFLVYSKGFALTGRPSGSGIDLAVKASLNMSKIKSLIIPRKSLLLALIFMLISAVTSSAQDFEGKNISSVVIRYSGAKTVDEARIRGHMAVRAGQKYSASRLDEDVRTLYESGLVDDVRFFAEPLGSSVKVVAEVKSRAQVVAIGFLGNQKFSDRKLAGVTKLKAGGVMSDEAILSARRKVQDHYRGFGYADVTVTHRIQSKAGGSTELVLIVDEGSRAEVRKIRFTGNTSIASHVLRNQMKTKQKGWFSFFTKSGRIDNEKLDADVERVLDYYRDRGYLRVSADLGRAPLEDGRFDLIVYISEGAKYTVCLLYTSPSPRDRG